MSQHSAIITCFFFLFLHRPCACNRVALMATEPVKFFNSISLSTDDLTQIRPPSPRSIALEYRRSFRFRLEQLDKADQATNSLNLNFLKEKAGRIMNKTAVDAFRIAEGGFNQAIAIIFDDGSDIIARVNCSVANDLSDHDNDTLERGVASEFAILSILRQETTIPLPITYAVDWRTDNPARGRYMLQERVIGQRIPAIKTPAETASIMNQIIEYESQVLNLHFPKIGCPLPNSDLKPSRENIGPLVDPYMASYAPPSLRGPFETSLEYLKARADAEYDLITNQTELWKTWRKTYKLMNQDPEEAPFVFLEEFYRLFRKSLDVLQFDCEFPCVLVNPEMDDIFVSWDDPSRIVAVIDWESSAAVPLWAAVLSEHHIRCWFADEKDADMWCEARRKHLGSTVPRFTEALESKSCLVRRNLSWLLRVRFSVCYSPKTVSERFLGCYRNWPEDAQYAFKELFQFLHNYGFSERP